MDRLIPCSRYREAMALTWSLAADAMHKTQSKQRILRLKDDGERI